MPIREKASSRGKPHKFNTAEVVAWMLERQAADNDEPVAEIIDFEEARARKVSAEADLAELQLATRRSELVEIDTVAGLVESAFATVRLRLLGMPARVAHRLAPVRSAAAIRRVLEDDFREVLEELVDGALVARSAAERDRERG
jgi:phage terminase Nu1 subunit (DNA packaging protein)